MALAGAGTGKHDGMHGMMKDMGPRPPSAREVLEGRASSAARPAGHQSRSASFRTSSVGKGRDEKGARDDEHG